MSKRHNAPKFRRKKKSHPILVMFILVIALSAGALSVFFATFDINAYRSALSQAIQDQTGRDVQFAGKLAWSFSLDQGISLVANNVVIKNPAWASRPDMARIGRAKLHVETAPLAQKKININAIDLAKMDVQLETAKNGDVNWSFTPKTNDNKDKEETKTAVSTKNDNVSIHVQGLTISDSRFGIKKADGTLDLYEVPTLELTNGTSGLRVHYEGVVQGHPVKIDLSGDNAENIMGAKWAFNLAAKIKDMAIKTQGTVSDGFNRVAMDTFQLTANESHIAGRLTVTLGGARPKIEGALTSETLDLSDLTLSSAEKTTTQSSPAASQPSGKIFSKEPLGFESLKAVDADVDVSINALALGLTTMKHVQTKLLLEGSRLTLDPVKGNVAGSDTLLTLKVNASTPTAQIATSLKASALDLSQLFKLGGMESAISGKTDVDINLTSSGASPHELAAHANGKINLLMDSGTVSSSRLSEIAGTLVQLFAPGLSVLSSPGVNCMAARYVITDGLLDTKGLIIDTEVTTISGKGYINLPDERIGMSLFTKPKAIGLSSIFPPMQISGPLISPSFHVDTASAAQKLAGLVTQSGTDVDGVPHIVKVPNKNACALALDNPNLAKPTSTAPLVPSGIGSVGNTVKDIGTKFLKGLLKE